MAAKGFQITTAWVSQDGENPWLLNAYDQFTEDAHGGTPDFFHESVSQAMKQGDEVRIVHLLVDYDAIEALFAARTIDADVVDPATDLGGQQG